MNKKIMTALGVTAVALSLAACGNSNHQVRQHSATAASTKPVHHEAKYNRDEYALMAYLKATNQSVGDARGAAQNISWQKDGDQYQFTSNGQPVAVKVAQEKVVVNANNQQSTFTKHELAKQFTDKKVLDGLLTSFSRSNANDQENNGSGSSDQRPAAQSTSQPTDSNGHITIAGHSFHHEDFYGNDILVGDNHEGEAGEYFANAPDLNKAQRVAAGTIATSQEHPNPN